MADSAASASTEVDHSSAKQEPLLALPAPGDVEPTRQLEVNGGSMKLDHLGPIIVNSDGTMSRIDGWAKLSAHEQAVALRRIAARNQEVMLLDTSGAPLPSLFECSVCGLRRQNLLDSQPPSGAASPEAP